MSIVKIDKLTQRQVYINSASADGGPLFWVCARENLRSAPHRH
jgi:hypothetical protein